MDLKVAGAIANCALLGLEVRLSANDGSNSAEDKESEVNSGTVSGEKERYQTGKESREVQEEAEGASEKLYA